MGTDDQGKPPPDIEIGGLSIGPFSLSAFKVRGLGRLGDLLFPERTARLEMARALTARVQDGGLAEHESQALNECVGLYLERLKNSNRVAQKAVEIFPEVEKQFKALPPYTGGPTTTSKEWKNKFRRQTEDVEDDALADLYARIACGEAARPGSFSVRTVEVLSALSREELQIFERARSFLISEEFLPEGIHGLSYSEILALTEARLLQATFNTSRDYQVEPNQLTCIRYGARFLVIISPTEASFSIPAELLTSAGIQLAQIPAMSFNEEYFRAFAKEIAGRTTVVGWSEEVGNNGTIRHFDPPL